MIARQATTFSRAIATCQLLLFATSGAESQSIEATLPKIYSIPTVDISGEKDRQVIVAEGTRSVYQGHPHTLLMPDGRTIFCVWTYNHGGACGPMKRSNDGGLAWCSLLPVPENWSSIRNCPTIHRLTGPDGTARLFVFAGNGDMSQSVSEDEGRTWSAMKSNGLKCVVAPINVLPIEDGSKYRMWVHRGERDRDAPPLAIWQADSSDGGLTWTDFREILSVQDANPCEPAVVRSPDGKQFLMLMRENSRRLNSLYMTSNDEGQTWSQAKELPAALTGDRHLARHAPDGRLVVVFRDRAEGETKGHFVAWIGRYDDILAGREGEYRVKLLHHHGRPGDCGYSGLELLPDGTFVATTYVKYEPGPTKNSVVSVRFRFAELDERRK